VPDSALAELAYRKPRVILFARLGIWALAQITERVVRMIGVASDAVNGGIRDPYGNARKY